MADQQRHLLLYVDVNKTMIMMDPIQGKDIDHVVNDILAEHSYGIVDSTTNEWTAQENGTISFSNYLRTNYPTNGGDKKKNKKIRKELRKTFTDPSNPGAHLKPDYHHLLDCLTLPSEIAHTAPAYDVGLETKYHFILPSFFNLILHLEREKRSFSIILRTFGQDIHQIAKEFNGFCQGKHPMYPTTLLDGTKPGSIDRRIHLPHGLGTFYRSNKETSLIVGTLNQPDCHEEGLKFYSNDESIQVVSGFQSIHTCLQAICTDYPSFAIRDDYYHWWKHDEAAEAGKLFLLDRNNPNALQLFFDDNILPHDPHIVDTRDIETGNIIPFEQTKDRHLIRVEPYEAICNTNYFIDKLIQAERS